MKTETPDHANRAHAEFGPSSLKYVAACAAYQGKDGTSASSEKGTRIHEALETLDPSALHDEEEVQMYETILRDQQTLLESTFGDKQPEIEKEIRVEIELDGTKTFGTCDFFARFGPTALMIDYKTGISKIDPPLQNWQAKAYALGAFQLNPDVETIHFAFIVPLRNEDLVGTFQRSDMPTLQQEISDVIKRGEITRPKWDNGTIDIDDCTPTVHCRYCRYEEKCPALGAVSIDIVKKYRPDLLPDGPINSTDVEDLETLEKLYTIAKVVETWASGIKNKAVAVAMSGHEFENHKLRSLGALKKTVDKGYLAQLAVRHGLTIDEVIAASELTMGQLSKAIADKQPKGGKAGAVAKFEEEALDLGIVEIGNNRYTLASK